MLHEYGMISEMNEIIKLNLDESAMIVGLSRKTLDDYFA